MRNIILLLVVSVNLIIFTSCNPNNSENDKEKLTSPKDSIEALIADITQKIERSPRNAALYHDRAIIYLQIGRMDMASEDMKTVISIDTTKVEYFITLTDVFFRTGKAGQAMSAIDKALELSPKNADAMLKRAELLLYFADHRKCINQINDVLEIDIHNPKAYFIRAFALKEVGDTTRAIENFQHTVDKDPDYYHAHIQLGLLFSTRKNPMAIEYFQNALNISPNSIEAWYGIGMFMQEIGDYNKAFEAYENILVIDPNYKNAHYNMGFINFQYLALYDEAAKHFTQALKADPSYVEAWYMRGLSYEKLGDLHNAKNDYLKSLSLRENYEKSLNGIQRIEKLTRR